MTSALSKAFGVLGVLRRTPQAMTLSAIAEAVGRPPSSAHSILNELLKHGLVTQDSQKHYRLGPAIYYLGSAYARNTPIYRVIWQELVNLCNDLGLVGAVAVPWEAHHLILQSHQGNRSQIGVAFGGRVPLDCGSWGKAHYAWSGDELPTSFSSYTRATITDPEEYYRAVEETLEQGYAIDKEEFVVGAGGVATAVTSDRGFEGLASCIGPISRIEELGFEEVGSRLSAIASQASLSLGDPGRVTLVGAESASHPRRSWSAH